MARAQGMRLLIASAMILGLAAPNSGAQQPDPDHSMTERDWAAPRLAWGQPDLQGVWTNASITKLERFAGVDDLVLTPDQARSLEEKDFNNQRTRAERRPTDPSTGAPEKGKPLPPVGNYNAFWVDPGSKVGMVKGQLRSSWITDPPDGKIPYSEAGLRKAREGDARLGYSDPEARPLPDRCLATGGRTGPPMVNGLYNNHYQIVQTPGHVLIHTEMISHARIIPYASAHAPSAGAIRPLFGDSIARWEGDTLVIETTNFNDYHAWQDHPAYLSKTAKVTERFTRISRDELLYAFTVEDPAFYARPWSGEIAFWNDKERIYEYACHEGNYAMAGILQGARVREAKGLPLIQALEE